MSLTTILINTIVSIFGILLGIFVATGSVMSIANMQVSWAGFLLFMAFGIPVAFGISGLVPWVLYAFDVKSFFIYLVAFPWVYLAAFIVAMLLTFQLHP